MLKYIILNSGDCALVVNDKIVMTADPDFDNTSVVEETAERLAEALSVGLQRLHLPTPSNEDWDWDQVVESLNAPQEAGDAPRG